jgi:hypothetical protein
MEQNLNPFLNNIAQIAFMLQKIKISKSCTSFICIEIKICAAAAISC